MRVQCSRQVYITCISEHTRPNILFCQRKFCCGTVTQNKKTLLLCYMPYARQLYLLFYICATSRCSWSYRTIQTWTFLICSNFGFELFSRATNYRVQWNEVLSNGAITIYVTIYNLTYFVKKRCMPELNEIISIFHYLFHQYHLMNTCVCQKVRKENKLL